MSGESTSVTERSCPQCGGEVVKRRSTQKYAYESCTECEWYETVEDGKYLPDGGTVEPENERVDLTELTFEVGEWAEENFGDQDQIRRNINERGKRRDPGADIGAMFCAMGVNEEAGELIHAVLKRAQGVREDEDGVGREAEVDAVGDIVIYLADFCHRRGYDLEECVRRAWDGEVSEREWDSETAGTTSMDSDRGGSADE